MPYKRAIILAPLFLVFEVILDLLQPRLMAHIIDEGVAKGNLRLIIYVCLIMLGTSLIAAFCSLGSTIFSSFAGQGFGTDLRSAVFRKVLSMSFVQTDHFSTGSLITRLTQDVSHLQHVLVMALRMLARQPIMCIGGCIMALQINWRLALILLVLVPLIVLLALFMFRISQPMFVVIQAKLDQVNSVIQENLAGIRVVKAFDRSSHEKARFAQVNEAYASENIRASRFLSGMRPLIMLIMNLGIIAVLWIGGWSIRQGNMTVGEVMAMISYLSTILFSILFASFALTDYARAKASADRIKEVLDVETTETHLLEWMPTAELTPPQPQTNQRSKTSAGCGVKIEFSDITFRYPGAAGRPVLDGISAVIEPGQTMAILGATGSGKSTLVHLLPRFYELQSGSILLDGRNLNSYQLTDLRERMGIVLQESVLFSGTVAENIRWGKRDASDDEIQHAAKIAQADDFIMTFQEGYDTIVGQRGITLSGGQKQRMAMARAFLKNPELLILDDCTSALDSETEKRLWQALRTHFHACTTILIAQRISSIMHADQILVMQDGRTAGIGTHQQLLQNCRVYQEIVESQTGESFSENNQHQQPGGEK